MTEKFEQKQEIDSVTTEPKSEKDYFDEIFWDRERDFMFFLHSKVKLFSLTLVMFFFSVFGRIGLSSRSD